MAFLVTAAFGQEKPGRGGRGPGGGGGSVAMTAKTQPKDDVEKKILETLEKIDREQGRMLNVPLADARMLRLLTETANAKVVVEFGTSNGVSGIWFGNALRKTGGKLITHEIDPKTAELARKNFQAAGVGELITVVVGDGHETAKKLTAPIDVVFIDADKDGYSDYLQKTLPLVRPGGLILAHNVSPRMPDQKFLKTITESPDLETIFYMDGGGLSVSMKKR
jgi:predicted O-methyltransferase YrrM